MLEFSPESVFPKKRLDLGSKNIPFKMLKDVGMTVEKQVQYICSKICDECSICAARQEMRAVYI